MKLKKHKQKCYLEPRKYLGLCIDEMDQKKIELPHFTKVPKNMEAKYFIAVHVVGCLVFNHRLRAKVYINFSNVHNDSNLTIHVIQDVLNGWEGDLPPVFYLQLDNYTSKENKNKFLIAYLHMLVEWGVFKKIKVGFLMVGDTHDQIDQMFSRFFVKLKKTRAYRLETLEEILWDSYRPKLEIKFVSKVEDFKKYVSD
jgi:hypothetical protein